jgi:type I restriction enzyme S subunit
MTVRAYPAYRDSGVEWIGAIPDTWEVTRVSARADLVNGFPFDSSRFEPNEGTPLVRIRDLGSVETEACYRGEIVQSALISNNDVLIGMDGDFNVGRWRGDGVALLNQRMCCLRGDRSYIRLLEYALPYPLKLINDVTYSTTVKHLSSGQVRNIRVAFPTGVAERHAIAAFLDRETGKIDALVAEQERLITLLKEKRQAVISRAVTKGLDPADPMKPSGVEWLGDVPAHWHTNLKLKTFAQQKPAAFTNGPFGSDLLTSEIQDEGVPVIYIRDLKVSEYSRTSTSCVKPDKALQLDKFRVDPGDILIAKVGDPPGFCCIYPDNEPAGIICQDVIRMKPNHAAVSANYLCHLLNSNVGIAAIDSICVELTRKRFSLGDLHSLRLPIPPISEQRYIAAHIAADVRAFDNLIEEAARASILLKERRAALISAAVTGKIDVRNLVQPAAEQVAAE